MSDRLRLANPHAQTRHTGLSRTSLIRQFRMIILVREENVPVDFKHVGVTAFAGS